VDKALEMFAEPINISLISFFLLLLMCLVMLFSVFVKCSVSDPYSFFPDPDPEVEAGGQYGSGYGSGSNPDPIRIQGFNDQKLKKNNSLKK
jgi:hypothetical protein